MPFWQDCIGCSGDCVGEAAAAALWLETMQAMDAGDSDFAGKIWGDLSGSPDLQENDTLKVVGGTFWYSYDEGCSIAECCLATDCNDGAVIAGTDALPFAALSADVDEDSGASGDPLLDWRPAGGIFDACNGLGWLTIAAGTTVSVTATSVTVTPPDFESTPARVSKADFTADYTASLYGFLHDVFGVTYDPDNGFAFNSYIAHVVFQNQRTQETYNVIIFNNSCF